MITRNEDGFDVDYDIFSLAGRAALIGGGIYALNESYEKGYFNNIKKDKRLNKRRNDQVSMLKDALAQDLVPSTKRKKEEYKYKETNRYTKTDAEIAAHRRNHNITVANIDSEIDIPGRGRVPVKSLFTGGYNNQSEDVPGLITEYQRQIMAMDNRKAVPINLTFDKNYKPISAMFETDLGRDRIHFVDEDSMVTMGVNGQNKSVAKSAWFTDPGTQTVTKTYGADVANLKFSIKNYKDAKNSIPEAKSFKEKNAMFMQFLQHSDKTYGNNDASKLNPKTIRIAQTGAILDPYRKHEIGNATFTKVMENMHIQGKAPVNASDLLKGLLHIHENPYADRPYEEYTDNPKQLHRSTVGTINKDGKKEFKSIEDVLFVDKDNIPFIEEALKKRGFDLGELAKEEYIHNADTAKIVSDNMSTISIDAKKETAASEYLMQSLASDAGMTPDEFADFLKNGGSINDLSPEIQTKIRSHRLSEHREYLLEEKNKALKNRQAMLAANKDTDHLHQRQKYLLNRKNAINGVMKGKHGVSKSFFEKDPETASNLQKHYDQLSAVKRSRGNSALQEELRVIRKELSAINKQLPTKLISSNEYKSARILKQAGKLDSEIKANDSLIELLDEEWKQHRVMGFNSDGKAYKLNKSHQNVFVDNVHVAGGRLTISTRKDMKVDVGHKAVDSSGILKATNKLSVPDLPGVAADAEELKLGRKLTPEERARFNGLTMIANRDALKLDAEDRVLASLFESIEMHAVETNNTKVLEVTNRVRANYSTMTEAEKVEAMRELKELGGGSYANISGKETGLGFRTKKVIAYGTHAEDMGIGGLGFFSERGLRLMNSIGLSAAAKEFVSRRVDKGAVQRYKDFEEVQKLMKDSMQSGFIDMTDLNRKDFIANVFPSIKAEGENVFETRSKYLGKKVNSKGVSFIELGEEINGVRRIPVFADERYLGHAGEQIGSNGDYKKYTEIEDYTRQIANEVRKDIPNRDRKKLETLIHNFNTATKELDRTLKKGALKDKFTESGTLQIASGSSKLKAYGEKMVELHKTEQAILNVQAIHKNKFIKIYGQKAYDDFKKTGISDAWSVGLREPADGLAAFAFNVVPGDQVGLGHLKENQTAILANGKHSPVTMIGGDFDQDFMSYGAVLSEEGKKQARELAFGNSKNSIASRRAMMMKEDIGLKSRGLKSIFDVSPEQRRIASFWAKRLEKGLVGHVSNAVGAVQNMNQRMNALVDPDRYYKNAVLVGAIVENTIKGKKQDFDELIGGRSQQILNAIEGVEDFAEASTSDRIKNIRGFLDRVILNTADVFGDRIRAGENSMEFISEVAETISGKTGFVSFDSLEEAKALVNNHTLKELTSDETLTEFINYKDTSRGIDGIADDSLALVDETRKLSPEAINKITKIEDITHSTKAFKSAMGKVGAEFLKYSLAPAAAFGALGTVFGTSGSIKSEFEVADSSKYNQSFKPHGSENLKAPRHMKPEITGKSGGGFQIDKYTAKHRMSDMRVQDDRRNFDYYDMQDMMKKGY